MSDQHEESIARWLRDAPDVKRVAGWVHGLMRNSSAAWPGQVRWAANAPAHQHSVNILYHDGKMQAAAVQSATAGCPYCHGVRMMGETLVDPDRDIDLASTSPPAFMDAEASAEVLGNVALGLINPPPGLAPPPPWVALLSWRAEDKGRPLPCRKLRSLNVSDLSQKDVLFWGPAFPKPLPDAWSVGSHVRHFVMQHFMLDAFFRVVLRLQSSHAEQMLYMPNSAGEYDALPWADYLVMHRTALRKFAKLHLLFAAFLERLVPAGLFPCSDFVNVLWANREARCRAFVHEVFSMIVTRLLLRWTLVTEDASGACTPTSLRRAEDFDPAALCGSFLVDRDELASVDRIFHALVKPSEDDHMGEVVFYAGKSQYFRSGNVLRHGARGEVVGPATTGPLAGKGLAVLFSGNAASVNCHLSNLRFGSTVGTKTNE